MFVDALMWHCAGNGWRNGLKLTALDSGPNFQVDDSSLRSQPWGVEDWKDAEMVS